MAWIRAYRPGTDFLRIRDLLVEAYEATGKPNTWDLCRWEYARHFVAPLRAEREGIRRWEGFVTVWDDDEAGIVGVVHTEEPWRGEAWVQRRPGWDRVLPEMVAHAEATLAHEDTGRLSWQVFEHDEALLGVLGARGYEQGVERTHCISGFEIGDLPVSGLPAGHVVRSMADDPDVEARRRVLGLGFDHTDPAAWPSVFAYEELMRAPDYRPDLDLFLVGPDGERVACCVVWLDEHNRMATLEPVSTRPGYRGRGLGREVVMEGIRRAAARGAKRVVVGTDLPFYLSIGFRVGSIGHTWSRV